MVVDEKDPASCRDRLGRPRQRHLDLRTLTRNAPDLGGSPGAREPVDDRARDPAPIGRDATGIEAATTVAYEDRHAVAARLRGTPRPAPRPSAAPRSASPRAPRAATVACRRPGSRARARPRPEPRARSRPPPRSPRGRRRATRPQPNPGGTPPSRSQPRNSRSCMRASRTTSRGSSARRCTSASVCNTESCRCAATSARSSERMRSRRSETSWFTSCQRPGPSTSAKPTSMTAAPMTPPRNALHESMLTKNAPRPATMHAVPVTIRASAPRRVPTSTATASAASGGSRSRKGQSGSSGASSCRRVESRAKPTIAAPSGNTITSPGQGPTVRVRNNTPSTTAENAIVETVSDERSVAASERALGMSSQPAA